MCGGVSPHSLTLWEWQALIWNWNDRHSTDSDKPEAASGKPSKDKMLAALAAKEAKC